MKHIRLLLPKFKTLRGQIILLLIIGLIPVIIIIEVISFYYTTIYMTDSLEDFNPQLLSQTAINMEMFLANYMNGIMEVAMDEDVTTMLQQLGSSSAATQISAQKDIESMLRTLAITNSAVTTFAMVESGGNTVTYSGYGSNPQYDDAFLEEILIEAMDSYSIVIRVSAMTTSSGEQEHYVHFAVRNLNKYNYNESDGVIIFSIKESALQEIYFTSPSMTNDIDCTMLILDENNCIISAENDGMVGMQMTDDEDLVSFVEQYQLLDSNNVMVDSISLSKAGWTVVSIIDSEDLFSKISQTQMFTLIMIIIAIVAVCGVVSLIAWNLTKSITVLVGAMNRVEAGEVTATAEIQSDNEIKQMAHHFNRMMEQINRMTAIEKEQAQLIHEANLYQKELEIKALEAQINPHFIYNTIDTINWTAIENDQPVISKMLKALGNILRYSIANSNEIVTIEQDLEWLQQYMYLQMFRFYNKFDYRVEVDPAVLPCKIHKLLLQPIIENAIIHAFGRMSVGGMIQVRIFPEDTVLKVEIEDNGEGITEEAMARIQAGILAAQQNQLSSTGDEIGVSNVVWRMQLYYGDRGSISYQDAPNGGTLVSLTVPIEYEPESKEGVEA